jgi:hypothetical protein
MLRARMHMIKHALMYTICRLWDGLGYLEISGKLVEGGYASYQVRCTAVRKHCNVQSRLTVV